MITCCLPIGESWGWGIAGKNIYRSLESLTNAQVELLNYETGLLHGRPVDKGNAVLNCLAGPSFVPFYPEVRGTRNVAYGFVEDFVTAKKYVSNAKRYWDHIVCGSSWMEQKMREIGIDNVSTALQGTDLKIFNENQRAHSESEFVIFSGGKFEYRKGQDIALLAARHMIQKYPDVRLVCAWNNPWLTSLLTMEDSKRIKFPNAIKARFSCTVKDIMAVNGMPQDRWEYVECDNEQMAAVYGRANVGLFLSRAEGGQNLVLQEAMACALPAIASHATGQRDILLMDNCLAVEGKHDPETGWFEPNLDVVIGYLEWAYSNRADLMKIGLAGYRTVRKFTWERTAKALSLAVNGSTI